MKPYHKIKSIFKRDMENGGRFTDEYSCPEFEYLKDNVWQFTEKVDGTNIRVIWDMQKLRFAGRTDNASIPTFLYDRLNEIFTVDKFKSEYPDTPIYLYGEGYGAKIQKGGGNYNSDGVDFILFDVLIDEWWLKIEGIKDVAEHLEIHAVPEIGEGTLDEAANKCHYGFNSHWGEFEAEGIVLKTLPDLKDRSGHRIITKVKCRDFK